VLVVATRMLNDGKGRTIHKGKHVKANFGGSPMLEYTELVLIERKVWDHHHFRNWYLPQIFPSKTVEKGHTRS
jgi:hypothetical protein